MAPRTRIVKISELPLSQFGLLAALNFQLFGMVTAYKMMELKQNLSLAAYLSARKTYLQRKRRYLQARRVHGFPNSLVLFNLICIEVDVLTLYLSFEIRETMNTILYFIAFSFSGPLQPGLKILARFEQTGVGFSAREELRPVMNRAP